MTLASQSRRGFLKRRSSRRYSRKRRRNRRITQLLGLIIIGGGIYTIAFWQPWKTSTESDTPTDLPAAAQTVDASPTTPMQDSLLDDDPSSSNVDLGIAATNALATHNEPEGKTTDEGETQETPTIEMGTDPNATGSRALRDALGTPDGQRTIPIANVETPDAPPATTRQRTSLTTSGSNSVQELLARASDALNRNSHVEARAIFNRVLLHPASSDMDRDLARDQLTSIAQLLTFSPTVMEDDPLAMRYTVRSGDSLSKIAMRNDLSTDWRFIQRINKITDPRRIRIGQTLKLVRGPFHAEISKRDYRLDLWAELPTDAGGGRIFIASFPVGLGEHNSTPAGAWRVRTNSRLINPPWTNPRTGEYFSADNPENPIGERWIGLEGIDDNTSVISGIGIHGTIEPQSIGTQASMGCVRMHDQDVQVIYELLAEASSTVTITP